MLVPSRPSSSLTNSSMAEASSSSRDQSGPWLHAARADRLGWLHPWRELGEQRGGDGHDLRRGAVVHRQRPVDPAPRHVRLHHRVPRCRSCRRPSLSEIADHREGSGRAAPHHAPASPSRTAPGPRRPRHAGRSNPGPRQRVRRGHGCRALRNDPQDPRRRGCPRQSGGPRRPSCPRGRSCCPARRPRTRPRPCVAARRS